MEAITSHSELSSSDPPIHEFFSGGHDLKELSSGNEKLVQDIFDTCGELTRAIRECPVPVIAAIDGVAAAAGCQLVAACDIAVATKKSSFSTPGASVGIFCSSPGVPLIRKCQSQDALQSGLISRLTEDTKALERELDEICKAIIDKPKGVIAMGKKFMYEQLEMRSYHEALVRAGDVMVQNLKYKDTKKEWRAFLKKKKPNWTHTHDKD
ncbi:Enoyl-CoA hydratase domain-containing protein 3, mitochondrial [Lepeophtheirus salmonis]|uniref:Enoyl-CoA hydratase domain-containing protein 3, mitochondrial n=1 Tax=Lepeophtheirus salmonis TaxID=72036 RepID=A0A7R8CRD9_LEPSM|nr:Enoyl-CoA hydratase domain-containing protein 3, mitochondrial [Lepeophtheirus salmonis]CAF2904216.1 Enoyl-CoA hydratase domain-containing protein 3, mitochondrial [Lepeophtheirus salmonis]